MRWSGVAETSHNARVTGVVGIELVKLGSFSLMQSQRDTVFWAGLLYSCAELCNFIGVGFLWFSCAERLGCQHSGIKCDFWPPLLLDNACLSITIVAVPPTVLFF